MSNKRLSRQIVREETNVDSKTARNNLIANLQVRNIFAKLVPTILTCETKQKTV